VYVLLSSDSEGGEGNAYSSRTVDLNPPNTSGCGGGVGPSVIINNVNISDCVNTDDASDSDNNSYVNNNYDMTCICGRVVGPQKKKLEPI
jgi:hypothetical protein